MIKKRESVIKTFGVSHRAARMALPVLAIVATSAVLPSEAEEQGSHALDADHEGSRLRGVMGRAAGTVKTFQYSEALKTWEEGTRAKWLTDTESVVPNNDMSFRVPKQAERASIISYLEGYQLLSASTAS